MYELEAIIPRHRFWDSERGLEQEENSTSCIIFIKSSDMAVWILPLCMMINSTESLFCIPLCSRHPRVCCRHSADFLCKGKSFRGAQSSCRYPLNLAHNSTDFRSNYFLRSFGYLLSMKSIQKLISTTPASDGVAAGRNGVGYQPRARNCAVAYGNAGGTHEYSGNYHHQW